MTFEMKNRLCGALFAGLPYFTGENKKESAAADRMNAFYESLYNAASDYAASAEFPAGGRYRALGECRACGDGEMADFSVSVRLVLKVRGRTVAEKELRHNWCGGVICKDISDTEDTVKIRKLRAKNRPSLPQ